MKIFYQELFYISLSSLCGLQCLADVGFRFQISGEKEVQAVPSFSSPGLSSGTTSTQVAAASVQVVEAGSLSEGGIIHLREYLPSWWRLAFQSPSKDGLMSYWRLVPYLHQQMRPAEGLFHINHIRFPRIKVKRFSTLKDIIATFSIFLGKYILTKVKVPRKRQYRVNEKTEAYQSYNHLQEKAQSGICSAGLEGKKPTLKWRSQCSSRRAMGWIPCDSQHKEPAGIHHKNFGNQKQNILPKS